MKAINQSGKEVDDENGLSQKTAEEVMVLGPKALERATN